jgi:putative acetyltransferase
MTQVQVTRAIVPTPDAVALIDALNAELETLYPPEQRHGLALEAIFQPHIRFFLAYANDKPAGCGGVALCDGFAEVKRMYVRPPWRGRGVAEAIMAQLVAETLDAGLPVLKLETGAESFAAHRFYARMGFRPCGKFASYAAMPPDAIAASLFLERQLAP